MQANALRPLHTSRNADKAGCCPTDCLRVLFDGPVFESGAVSGERMLLSGDLLCFPGATEAEPGDWLGLRSFIKITKFMTSFVTCVFFTVDDMGGRACSTDVGTAQIAETRREQTIIHEDNIKKDIKGNEAGGWC